MGNSLLAHTRQRKRGYVGGHCCASSFSLCIPTAFSTNQLIIAQLLRVELYYIRDSSRDYYELQCGIMTTNFFYKVTVDVYHIIGRSKNLHLKAN